jgi:hypothetical protein
MASLSSFSGGNAEAEKAAAIDKVIQSGAPKGGSGLSPKPAAEPQEVRVINQPSITLTKNTKGYNWEIKAYAETISAAVDLVIAADNRLKAMYPQKD